MTSPIRRKATEARELARLFRRAGYITSREDDFVEVVTPGASGERLYAMVFANHQRPYIGVLNVQSPVPGTRRGTRFVDELSAFVVQLKMRGLAFSDVSEGAEEGAGFWRQWAEKRGWLLERDDPIRREILGQSVMFIETRIIIDAKVPHVDNPRFDAKRAQVVGNDVRSPQDIARMARMLAGR